MSPWIPAQKSENLLHEILITNVSFLLTHSGTAPINFYRRAI